MGTPTIHLKSIDISDFAYLVLERKMYQCERCLSTLMDGVPIIPYLKREDMNKGDPENYFCSCPDCVDIIKWIYNNNKDG